jgi:hypothetical protein
MRRHHHLPKPSPTFTQQMITTSESRPIQAALFWLQVVAAVGAAARLTYAASKKTVGYARDRRRR